MATVLASENLVVGEADDNATVLMKLNRLLVRDSLM